ncbi:potassium channel family protein [Kribbella sp. NBC_01245]|uniref:potassium channel family protein n=1 Tax=Kribbella sp. NBC_01245 TaxID=2903578 RepID=UPI002E2DC35B|nr:ion channel [Kribbella sp. NBC_01245]
MMRFGPPDEASEARWERLAEWPLTILAVLFLVAYAWPILVPDLSPGLVALCQTVTWVAWSLFAFDYIARLLLSASRLRFVATNLVDLAVIALPVLRPLRLLRLLTLLNVMNRYAGSSLRGRVAVYVAGSSVLLVFIAALAVLDAERGRDGATIQNFGDALWWALTTVTTVGYGDRYPVTAAGRVIAAGLMLAGIALLGVVTASLASWLVQRVAEVEEEGHAITRADLAALSAEVASLRAELIAARQAQSAAQSAERPEDVERG